MPLNLDTPDVVNDTVVKFDMRSFAVDIERREIHVEFVGLNSSDVPIREYPLVTILGTQDFNSLRNRANAVAATNGGNVFNAFRTALYEQVLIMKGKTGSEA